LSWPSSIGTRTCVQLRQISIDVIKEELEKIDGVASASVEGGLEREILVEINQDRLRTYGIPILDVSDAITNANLNYPAGTIKESFYEYLIRTLGEFKDIREIEEVVIKSGEEDQARFKPFEEQLKEREISPRAKIVHVNDVANVVDTFKERSSFSRFNGDENVSISIQKQAQTNTIQVVDRIRRSFGRIEKILPEDIKLEIIYDQSDFIRDAINGVRDAALQGGLLAFLVLFLFLRNLKSSAIVTLSIPISVMVVFTFMYFGGLSINIMSLGGLALGVGMLVDNAIVVIENIFRHREFGESAEKAATEGAEEVSNAIIASTLTTIAVFLPMIFVVGVAGQLFKELAFTVTFALIASLWVALTLIPLLSCKLGGGKEAAKGAAAFAGGEKWKNLLKKYEVVLRKFILKKGMGLASIFLIFVASLFMVNLLEKELMPKTDQGQFIVKAELPVGTRVEETNKVVLKAENMIMASPYVESVSSVIGSTRGESAKDIVKRMGSHEANIIVTLKQKRKATTAEVVQILRDEFKKEQFGRAKLEFSLQQGVIAGAFGGGAKPITIEIKGEKLEMMEYIAKKIEDGLSQIDGVFGIEDDVPEASPEVRINIDKDKASLYNLSVVDMARVSQMVLRGYIPSQFKEKGHEIDIRVQLRKEDRDSYDKLYRIHVNTPAGVMLPLGTVAAFEKGIGSGC